MTAARVDGPAVTVRVEGPPPAGGSTLERLLHPVPPGRFLSAYWQHRPLHLTGWPDRLRGLPEQPAGDSRPRRDGGPDQPDQPGRDSVFSREALRSVLRRQYDAGLWVRVSGDHEGDDGAAGVHRSVDAADIADHLRAGTSLCVDPVDRADPAVAALAETLRRELGHVGAVSVKCYLSTAGYGFNTHFDAHVVTTLQVEGCKRWRFSPVPGVPFPLDNAFLDADGQVRYTGRRPSELRPWETPAVDRDGFVEVTLHPGDVLCLPAGTWHEAKAIGGHSLALNVAFAPADPLALVVDWLRERFAEAPAWRAGPPPAGPFAGPPPAAHAPVAGLAPAVRAYLGERVTELLAALTALPDDPRVARRWGPAHAAPRPAQAAPPPALAVPPGVRQPRTPGVDPRPPAAIQCVIPVRDLRAAVRWYERVLDCREVFGVPEFGWAELTTRVPGVTLGLTETVGQHRETAGGITLNVRVDDLADIRRRLTENGIDDLPTDRVVAGVAELLAAHDPDGNPLLFYRPISTQPGKG